MWQKAAKYGAILIGLYIVVEHVAGTGKLLGGGSSLVSGTVKSLQGSGTN